MLYEAAVGAGEPALDLADRRAEAALTAGDLDAALAFADQVLTARSRVGDEQVTRAVTVAAAALAHRGLLARSAELHRWSAARPDAAPAVAAVPALIGTGALAEAEDDSVFCQHERRRGADGARGGGERSSPAGCTGR